jgi:hypothetical protein
MFVAQPPNAKNGSVTSAASMPRRMTSFSLQSFIVTGLLAVSQPPMTALQLRVGERQNAAWM